MKNFRNVCCTSVSYLVSWTSTNLDASQNCGNKYMNKNILYFIKSKIKVN